MVIFEHKHFREIFAVVHAAARLYRVFFGPAQAGRGFARIQQAHARAIQFAHVAGREVGDAREMGDEIEDDPVPP